MTQTTIAQANHLPIQGALSISQAASPGVGIPYRWSRLAR